jgi:hypothetical protein
MPAFGSITGIVEDDETLNLGRNHETDTGAGGLPSKNRNPSYFNVPLAHSSLRGPSIRCLTLHPGHEVPYSWRGKKGGPLEDGLVSHCLTRASRSRV